MLLYLARGRPSMFATRAIAPPHVILSVVHESSLQLFFSFVNIELALCQPCMWGGAS